MTQGSGPFVDWYRDFLTRKPNQMQAKQKIAINTGQSVKPARTIAANGKKEFKITVFNSL